MAGAHQNHTVIRIAVIGADFLHRERDLGDIVHIEVEVHGIPNDEFLRIGFGKNRRVIPVVVSDDLAESGVIKYHLLLGEVPDLFHRHGFDAVRCEDAFVTIGHTGKIADLRAGVLHQTA